MSEEIEEVRTTEVEEANHGKKRIVSTVIMGILILIMLTYTLIMLPVDLKQTINQIMESSKENAGESSSEQAGAVIGGVIGAFFAALLVILLHAGFFICIIGGGVLIIFIVKNIKKAYLKQVKIVNWVYVGLLAFIIITAIVKLLILFIAK